MWSLKIEIIDLIIYSNNYSEILWFRKLAVAETIKSFIIKTLDVNVFHFRVWFDYFKFTFKKTLRSKLNNFGFVTCTLFFKLRMNLYVMDIWMLKPQFVKKFKHLKCSSTGAYLKFLTTNHELQKEWIRSVPQILLDRLSICFFCKSIRKTFVLVLFKIYRFQLSCWSDYNGFMEFSVHFITSPQGFIEN